MAAPRSPHEGPGASSAGFTIAEALVALVIAAIGMQAALDIFASHATHRRDAAQRRMAVAHADTMLAQIGGSSALVPGTSHGVLPPVYRWRMTMTPLSLGPMTELRIVPYDVVIEVAWNNGPKQQTVRLQTIKLGLPAL